MPKIALTRIKFLKLIFPVMKFLIFSDLERTEFLGKTSLMETLAPLL